MATKEELNAALKDASGEITVYQRRIQELKKALMDTESLLIESAVQRDKLTEQLYRLNASTEIDPDDALREKQMQEFSERLPSLLEKIK